MVDSWGPFFFPWVGGILEGAAGPAFVSRLSTWNEIVSMPSPRAKVSLIKSLIGKLHALSKAS